jgi:hypothetical protein
MDIQMLYTVFLRLAFFTKDKIPNSKDVKYQTMITTKSNKSPYSSQTQSRSPDAPCTQIDHSGTLLYSIGFL